jgi:hypothetical protein
MMFVAVLDEQMERHRHNNPDVLVGLSDLCEAANPIWLPHWSVLPCGENE